MHTLDTAPVVEAPVPGPVRRRSFGPMLLGGIFVVLGSLWALDLAGTIDVRATVVLPALLIVLGLGLIFGANDGPHSGLVVAGVFLSMAVVVAAAVPGSPFTGGVGDRRFEVTDPSQLEASYGVGLGNLILDLDALALTEEASVSISVGAGELTVLLPDDLPVDINATSGAGEVNLLGERTDGVAVTREYQSEGFSTAQVRLRLDLNVGAGSIEVTR